MANTETFSSRPIVMVTLSREDLLEDWAVDIEIKMDRNSHRHEDLLPDAVHALLAAVVDGMSKETAAWTVGNLAADFVRRAFRDPSLHKHVIQGLRTVTR